MLHCTDPKRHQISRGTRRFWIASSSVPCMCIYSTLSFAKALPLLVKKNDPYREDISAPFGRASPAASRAASGEALPNVKPVLKPSAAYTGKVKP